MAIYQKRNPLGFKNLLTWQQADEIYKKTKILASKLPKRHPKTNQFMNRLIDHLVDSARSVKRNIEEGHKRTTTSEYIEFLGFSLGSLEELHGDLVDLEKDVIEWQEENGEFKENRGEVEENPKGFEEISRGEIGELIRLCRGEDKMLNNQIRGLEKRREKMGYRTSREQEELIKQRVVEGRQREKEFFDNLQRESGSVRLINGQFISQEKYQQRLKAGEELELWEES